MCPHCYGIDRNTPELCKTTDELPGVVRIKSVLRLYSEPISQCNSIAGIAVGAGFVHLRQPVLDFGSYDKMTHRKIYAQTDTGFHPANLIARILGNGGMKQTGDIGTRMYRQTGFLRKAE